MGEPMFDDISMVELPPLAQAARDGSIDLACQLLNDGEKVDCHDKNTGCTPLWFAAHHDKRQMVRLLLDNECVVDAINLHGETPLYAACRKGHMEIVTTLVNAGANVDYPAVNCLTPLMTAAYHGHMEVVMHLVDKGADISTKTTGGLTAARIAKEQGNPTIQRYLQFQADFQRAQAQQKAAQAAKKGPSLHVDVYGQMQTPDSIQANMLDAVSHPINPTIETVRLQERSESSISLCQSPSAAVAKGMLKQNKKKKRKPETVDGTEKRKGGKRNLLNKFIKKKKNPKKSAYDTVETAPTTAVPSTPSTSATMDAAAPSTQSVPVSRHGAGRVAEGEDDDEEDDARIVPSPGTSIPSREDAGKSIGSQVCAAFKPSPVDAVVHPRPAKPVTSPAKVEPTPPPESTFTPPHRQTTQSEDSSTFIPPHRQPATDSEPSEAGTFIPPHRQPTTESESEAATFIPPHREPAPPKEEPSEGTFIPPHRRAASPESESSTFVPPHRQPAPPEESRDDSTFIPPHRQPAQSPPPADDSTFIPPHRKPAAAASPEPEEGTFIPPHRQPAAAEPEEGTFIPPHRQGTQQQPTTEATGSRLTATSENQTGNTKNRSSINRRSMSSLAGEDTRDPNRYKDPSDLYVILEKLDAGASGEVFKGSRKIDGETVAIKKIPFDNQEDLTELQNEIAMMRAACHISSVTLEANVVRFFDSHAIGNQMWIVMEFMSGGKLTDLIKAVTKLYIDEAVIAYVLKEILKGLDYLHTRGIIHRDIKSDNILVNHDGSVKLGDFGLSALIAPNSKRCTILGTPFWMAPEVIQGSPYNYKADIWSLGIIALELVDGDPPYMDCQPVNALFKIVRNPPPRLKNEAKYSAEFVNCLNSMLVKDPDDRPSATELLQHPFLNKACDATKVKKLVSKLRGK
eukprot:TRINITY_DN61398_c0_g3_i1.p1 TRINITY_DN61398_c0_g3~~TRINITY_DN61398_c0_g3_i1.p1  ORF type:complete len:912 (-),score=96.77 TRINITY_DN61398_c0_g3_i1:605-3340(-)